MNVHFEQNTERARPEFIAGDEPGLDLAASAARKQAQRLRAEIHRLRTARTRALSAAASWVLALAAASLLAAQAGPLWALLAVSTLAGLLTLVSPTGRTAARALAEAGDPHAAAALVLAATEGDRATRQAAEEALALALPRLSEESLQELGSDAREALPALLASLDGRLLVAVLRALGKVGGSRAIPAVRRVAESPAPPGDLRALARGRWRQWHRLSHYQWEEVRTAARQALAELEDRERQARLRTTLLRPATAEAGSEPLLRPAADACPENPLQLLRPAGNGQTPGEGAADHAEPIPRTLAAEEPAANPAAAGSTGTAAAGG